MTSPSVEFQRGLGLHQRGQLDDAEKIYRSILASQPRYFDAVYALGLVHLQRQQYEAAERQFALALKLNPKSSPLQNNRGNAFTGMGQSKEAIASYERAISLDPKNAEAFYNLGNALVAVKQFDAAVTRYDQSIALFPNNPNIHNNRGSALAALNRLNEAIASYDRALKLDATFANALGNRGAALASLGRNEEAIENLQRAVALMPADANLFYSLGQLFVDLKQYDRAIPAFDKALTLNPELGYARSHRLFAKLQICQWTDFEKDYAAVLESLRRGTSPALPFSILALPSTSADQKICATAFATAKSPAWQKPLWHGERYTHDRIKIGYVSSDLRDHPVAHLIAGMLEAHDRSRFEISAYSTAIPGKDPFRNRIADACEIFIEADSMSDADIAQRIRISEIDILIDLNGYTERRRTGIFAMRPAPVQINYLGYPGTMGASYIDYLIADLHIIPSGAESNYSEKIVRLPNSYQPNDSKRSIANETNARAEHGLPGEGFVFVSFNNNFKITPDIFDVWMRLLKSVDGSVLWLFCENSSAIENLKREATQRGIASDRLIFASRLPLDQHLARHKLADLFLDTPYYNAHTTASDALWAGLPVITCPGETFASRVAASLLHAIGLPELVTHSLQDYEDIAFKLATHPDQLAEIKSKLAHNRDTAPLFDIVRYTRHLEAAYTRMWERSQKGKSPQSFTIEPIS